MASDYPVMKIGDIAASVSDTHKFGKEQLVFLNTSDILHGRFLHRTYSAVKDWPGQAKKSIRKDDILFSEIRPANGRWAYVEHDADDFVVSTKLMVIRANQDRVFPKFLYQHLTSSEVTQWLQHLAESRSGTFPQITFDQVASLELPLPPLAEQRAIASVLGVLDDKIELNQRMAATLEELARTIFKSWFIDFDPVRAKADGRPTNLPPEIDTLFPSSFTDDGIPEEWEQSTLDTVVAEAIGGDWGKDEPSSEFDSEALCIRGADIPALQDGGFGKMPTRYLKASSLQKRALADGDIVLEISGGSPTQSTGRVVLISSQLLSRREVPLICSNFCRILRPSSKHLSGFIYYWMRHLYDLDELYQYETGTTGIKNFAYKHFSQSRQFALPSSELLDRFHSTCRTLRAKQLALAADSEILASIRDALLPKLISGEIRVTE